MCPSVSARVFPRVSQTVIVCVWCQQSQVGSLNPKQTHTHSAGNNVVNFHADVCVCVCVLAASLFGISDNVVDVLLYYASVNLAIFVCVSGSNSGLSALFHVFHCPYFKSTHLSLLVTVSWHY